MSGDGTRLPPKKGLGQFLSTSLAQENPYKDTDIQTTKLTDLQTLEIQPPAPQPTLPEPEVPKQQTSKLPKPQTYVLTKSVTTNVDGPLFDQLERKEARFRSEQIEGLDKLSRRLSRLNRGSDGPRLTANTLIRVAVDLLLEHGDCLTTDNEDRLLEQLKAELKQSL